MNSDTIILKYLLEQSVKKCKKEGLKVAIQISGGLDSAIIQAMANSHHLYCCTWEDQDNITMAERASFGWKVKPVTFTKEEMIEVLPTVKKLTNGKGTWSQVCQYFLCRQIAEDKCDVVLTGEGADELFGGYSRYRILWHLDNMFNDPRLQDYKSIIEHVIGPKIHIVKQMLNRHMHDSVVEKLLPNSCDLLSETLADIERCNGLPNLLNFGEAIADEFGLKCLFPFMHESIQQFALDLPEHRKINEHYNKAILRELALVIGIDEQIISETTKKGLFIPQSWRPENEPLWSRKWFEDLMDKA